MDDAWQILADAGLPLVMATTGTRRTATELAGAVRRAIATGPRGCERDALASFIGAWAAHWPSTFAAELGDDVLAWARAAAAEDENRYIKLRRIAIAGLASARVL